MSVSWSYFDKFKDIVDRYMPSWGEGRNMASQIVTAVNKLIYSWYNDGDVYDNTFGMKGWVNDLSSYANWLDKNVDGVQSILDGIMDCYDDSDYEYLLQELADKVFRLDFLKPYGKRRAVGTIYECDGRYEFREY